jgi:protein-tyrosine sulfotransferase
LSSADPEPIFLVTAGRSGSTLLRLILDDHPEIGCPGETGLPSLISHIANVWHTVASDVERAHVEVMSGEVKAAVRQAAVAPMRFYTASEDKRIFCDKSLETAWHLEAIHDVFPEAKFIMLFRHVMDVVASGIAASPWGFSAFGYAPYVSRSVDNFVAPLVDHWNSQASLALDWIAGHEEICHRVRYEDLVGSPQDTLRAVWDFIGVRNDVEVGPGVFERARAARTPGDVKVAFTEGIHQDSLGAGRRVPVEMIPKPLLERINERLKQLGYDEVTPDWNGEPVGSGELTPESELSLATLTALLARVQPAPEPEDPSIATTFAVVADDRSGLRWVVGRSGATVDLGTSVPATLIGSSADLVAALKGTENAGQLMRQRRLRIRFHDEEQRKREPGMTLTSFIERLRARPRVPR